MVDSIDPLALVAKTRELCEGLCIKYTMVPHETTSEWRDRFASAKESFIVAAGDLMPKLADELEDVYQRDMELRVRVVGKIGEIETLERERDEARLALADIEERSKDVEFRWQRRFDDMVRDRDEHWAEETRLRRMAEHGVTEQDIAETMPERPHD